MKKIFIVAFCVVLMLNLFSCQKNDDSESNDTFLKGVEQGEENIFLSLVNASTFDVILSYNEVWETEDFSICLADLQVETTHVAAYDDYDHIFKCRLMLNDCTLDEAYEEKSIYVGIYSRTANGKWRALASDYESYYMSAVLDDNYTLGDNAAEAKFKLYDNPKYIVIIIVIGGALHKISYHCQG